MWDGPRFTGLLPIRSSHISGPVISSELDKRGPDLVGSDLSEDPRAAQRSGLSVTCPGQLCVVFRLLSNPPGWWPPDKLAVSRSGRPRGRHTAAEPSLVQPGAATRAGGTCRSIVSGQLVVFLLRAADLALTHISSLSGTGFVPWGRTLWACSGRVPDVG